MDKFIKYSRASLIMLTLMTLSFSETITIYGAQSARYSSNSSASCCSPNSLFGYDQGSMYVSGCWWHNVYEQCFENRNTAIWSFDLSNLPDMQSFNSRFEYDLNQNYCENSVYIATSNEYGPILTDLAYNLWNNPDWENNYVECNNGTHAANIPQSQISYASQSGQLNVILSAESSYIDNTGLDAPRLIIDYQPYECNDLSNDETCELDDNCQWIEDIEWGNCGSYNNSNSCNNAHPDCSWMLCYGGGYGDWYYCCQGGSFQDNNSYCEELPSDPDPSTYISFGNISLNTMEINYLSESHIGGFQFTLTDNPNLISITEISGGAADEADFTVSYNDDTGIIIGFSFTGNQIIRGEGLLTNIHYTRNDPGTIELCLTDIIISNPNGESLLSQGDCTQLVDSLLGDLNGDTIINILDIIILVDLIINEQDNNDINADINEDSEVNILDVVLLVNIVLGNT